MLKVLSLMFDRDDYIFIKSPPEKYFNSKNKIIEKGEEKEPLKEYQNAIIVFDDTLASSKSR